MLLFVTSGKKYHFSSLVLKNTTFRNDSRIHPCTNVEKNHHPIRSIPNHNKFEIQIRSNVKYIIIYHQTTTTSSSCSLIFTKRICFTKSKYWNFPIAYCATELLTSPSNDIIQTSLRFWLKYQRKSVKVNRYIAILMTPCSRFKSTSL